MGPHTSVSDVPARVRRPLSAVRRFVRAVRSLAVEIERETGLSTAQTSVLQLLIEAPASSVNELAERTATDQSSVSVVVARLEAKGLVSRMQSTTDARRTTVSITAAGRLCLAQLGPTVQGRLVRALNSLDNDALASLEHELTQLTALMGAAHEPATFIFEDDATGSP